MPFVSPGKSIPVLRPKPKRLSQDVSRSRSEQLRERDRPDVRGLGEDLRDRHLLGGLAVRLVDHPVRDPDAGPEVEDSGRRDESLGQRSRDGDDLQRRAGLVRVRDGAVALDVPRGLGEAIRVEPRLRRHRQHLAGVRVEHDGARRHRPPAAHRPEQDRLGVGLEARVDREADVAPLDGGLGANHVERAAERIAGDHLAAVTPAERLLERELEPGQAFVVDACEAEDVRTHGALRVDPALLRVEPEPLEAPLLEQSRPLGIGLPRQVDEAAGLVRELPVELVWVDPERPRGGESGRMRVRDVPGVRVDGRRPSPDRKPDAVPVDHRAARRLDDDVDVMLPLRDPVEPLRVNGLEPDGPAEGGEEGEGEECEQEPDPPVRKALAHRFPRSR